MKLDKFLLLFGLGVSIILSIFLLNQQEEFLNYVENIKKDYPLLGTLSFISLYAISTFLLLPSTAFNIAGGVIFGTWLGLLWTMTAAIIASIMGFFLSRLTGKHFFQKQWDQYKYIWEEKISQYNFLSIFILRLLPIIPYGLVSLSAGLSGMTFKDYLLGTILGTGIGIFPFVLMGSYAIQFQDNLLIVSISIILIILFFLMSRYFFQKDKN